MNSSIQAFTWLEWAADLSPLPDFLLKATVILLLAWVGAFLLRGRNPHWRVLLWRSVLVGLLILPGFAAMTPKVSLVVAGALNEDTQAVSIAISVPHDFSIQQETVASIDYSGYPQDTLPARPPAAIERVSPPLQIPPANPAIIPPAGASEEGPFSQGNRILFYWIWGIGVVLLLIRMILSHRKVRSFVKESQHGPLEVVCLVEQVARDLGIRGQVEVRSSSLLQTPFLTGVFHPVLLLPTKMTRMEYRKDLPAVLAHELCHVRTLDLIWGWGFHLMSIVLWPHPLIWRIRRSHMDACEEVCDAAAANYIGSMENYSSVLARVAYALHTSPPAVCGIAMARLSTVSRRLAALKRLVQVRPLSRKMTAGALAVTFSTLFLIAALDLVRAEPEVEAPQVAATAFVSEPEKQVVASSVPKIKLHLVDKATQAVIANTTVEMRINVSGGCGNYVDTPFKTGPDGEATLVSTATNPAAFGFHASLPGYVSMGGMWYRESEPRITSMPSFVNVEFEKGTTLGGVVKDEAGKPVAGVHVEPDIYRRDDSSRKNPIHYSLSNLTGTTDSNGRWSCAAIPQSLNDYQVGLAFSHPEYVLERSWNTGNDAEVSRLRNGSFEIIMRKGSCLSGRVVDELGHPIVGATARIGRFSEKKESRTGADGIFVIDHVPGHSTSMVVKAEGYAPIVIQAAPSDKGLQFLVEMKRGVPLRGRVVDEKGNPIEGATVSTDSMGFSVLEEMLDEKTKTDATGRFEWIHSPLETLNYSVLAEGYQGFRQLLLKPGETEHIITLHPPIHVSGRVLDASTQEPITEFEFIPGIQWTGKSMQISWQEETGQEKTLHGGTYDYVINDGHPGMAFKVKAKGYLPAETAVIPRDAAREMVHDFLLVKGSGPSGRVVDLDGKPLAGASVVLCKSKEAGYICNGLDASFGSAKPVQTGQDGRFTFEEPTDVFKLICVHDKGYATITPAEFSPDHPIQIQPWGRVEGRLLFGTKPAPSEIIVLCFPFGDILKEPECTLDYRATTDSEGKFTFDHVFPGQANAQRQFMIGSSGSGIRMGVTHSTHIEIRSGETTTVQIGGTGRPVIGQLKMPGGAKDAEKVQWRLVHGSIGQILPKEIEASIAGKQRNGEPVLDRPHYSFIAHEDGSFRVEDIPEGNYTFSSQVPKPDAPDPMEGGSLGSVWYKFTVPPMESGRSDEPLDLGVLEVTVTGN